MPLGGLKGFKGLTIIPETKKQQSQVKKHQQNVSPQKQTQKYIQQTNGNYRFNLLTFDKIINGVDDMDVLNKAGVMNIQQIKKTSASESIVYTGVFHEQTDQNVYIKAFSISKKDENNGYRLLYEKEVYRYIKAVASHRVAFIKNLTDDDIQNINNLIIQMKTCIVNPDLHRYYIATEDTGGTTLLKLTDINAPPLDPLIKYNIFFELLYVIYLLHEKLKVAHNDMHRGNVIIVPNKQQSQTTKQYTMFGTEYNMKYYPYHVKVYDFDLASIYGGVNQNFQTAQNKYLKMKHDTMGQINLCERTGRCPNNPDTDLYIWYKDLIRCIRGDNDTQIINDFMKTIKINQKLQKVIQTSQNVSWYAFCKDISKGVCTPAKDICGFTLKSIVDLYYNTILVPLYKSQTNPAQSNDAIIKYKKDLQQCGKQTKKQQQQG